jgi:hypothetical protein
LADSIVPQELLKKLPRTAREELPTLPKEAQQKFMELYEKRGKKLLIAYPLCLLYGLHYVYLEETSTGIWFWFTIGGFGVWWLINFFTLPGSVKTHNSMAALKTIGEVRPVEESKPPHF